METLEIRNELRKFVETGDETMLRFFYAMATEYKKTRKKSKTTFSETDFINGIIEAEKQIEQGDFQTIEDFEKETQLWK